MSQPKTNADAFQNLCQFSNPLTQAFMVDACVSEAKRMLRLNEEKQGAPEGFPDLIAWDTWVESAKDIVAEFDKLK